MLARPSVFYVFQRFCQYVQWPDITGGRGLKIHVISITYAYVASADIASADIASADVILADGTLADLASVDVAMTGYMSHVIKIMKSKDFMKHRGH